MFFKNFEHLWQRRSRIFSDEATPRNWQASEKIGAIFLVAAASVVSAIAAAPAAEVEVHLLGGRQLLRGTLVSLSPDIGVRNAGDVKRVAVRDVKEVKFAPVAPEERPSVWLDLRDGSKLQAVQITARSGKAVAELIGGAKVEFPLRSVHSLRFRSRNAALAAEWEAIGNGALGSDVLVIRKNSQRTVEENGSEPKTVSEVALDQIEGTIVGIAPESVQFNFDGEVSEVNREKIEGIYFYAAAARQEEPTPLCRLVDAGGSEWALRSIELSEKSVTGVTTSGIAVKAPLDSVARIDYSAGNVLYLGDAEPDAFTLGESLQPAGMEAKFSRLHQAWQNRRFGSNSLTLAGNKFYKGLALTGQATVSYRVPQGFAHFHATAGIDDSVELTAGMTLTILGDGAELFKHEFTADRRGPISIDVPTSKVRRLAIVVTPNEGQGFGDLLNLCEARLTK